MDQVLSQNDQWTFQIFLWFGGVRLTTSTFFLQDRLTGLLGLAPPPVWFWLLPHLCLPSLYLVPEGGRADRFSNSSILLAFCVLSVRTFPAAILPNRETPQRSNRLVYSSNAISRMKCTHLCRLQWFQTITFHSLRKFSLWAVPFQFLQKNVWSLGRATSP